MTPRVRDTSSWNQRKLCRLWRTVIRTTVWYYHEWQAYFCVTARMWMEIRRKLLVHAYLDKLLAICKVMLYERRKLLGLLPFNLNLGPPIPFVFHFLQPPSPPQWWNISGVRTGGGGGVWRGGGGWECRICRIANHLQICKILAQAKTLNLGLQCRVQVFIILRIYGPLRSTLTGQCATSIEFRAMKKF